MKFSKSSGERGSRIDLGKHTLVRYKKGGIRFEIVVNPEQAWMYTQGESVSFDEVVEGNEVFENFTKGLKASQNDLEHIFQTTDKKVIAKIILERGELQITQEMRKRFLHEKIAEVVKYLTKHTINPKTLTPHPPARIEKAMDEMGVNIYKDKGVKEQALKVYSEISSILPIKMEIVTINFVIPSSQAGSLYGTLHDAGEILEEQWNDDGSLTANVQIPAGIQAKLMEEVADRTKGKAQVRITQRSDVGQ